MPVSNGLCHDYLRFKDNVTVIRVAAALSHLLFDIPDEGVFSIFVVCLEEHFWSICAESDIVSPVL